MAGEVFSKAYFSSITAGSSQQHVDAGGVVGEAICDGAVNFRIRAMPVPGSTFSSAGINRYLGGPPATGLTSATVAWNNRAGEMLDVKSVEFSAAAPAELRGLAPESIVWAERVHDAT